MPKTYTSLSPTQTKRLGESLAKHILEKGLQDQVVIIGLVGELGTGKTCFLQGFAQGLHIRSKILSPTFAIMKKYKIQDTKYKVFFHIDCYRIENTKEILDLGFADMCGNPTNIIAIEWADRVKKILPNNTLILKFRFLDKNKREIKTYIFSCG